MQDNNDLLMRLDMLKRLIQEKEDELENIHEIGIMKAGVTSDYVHDLRVEHLSYQREYNLILDQNPSLAAIRTKIIIDTFKDHRLESKEYQILEPVEVDIEKHLAENRMIFRNVKIGEDSRYEIFLIYDYFLRRDKNTSLVVYLGLGSSIAAIFNHWIWYEYGGGIAADRYICRRSMDGRFFDRFDWLSNKKFFDGSHYVSEDTVKKISADSLTLLIEVYRRTKGETYKITVSDVNGEINVKWTFPWEDNSETSTQQEVVSSSIENKPMNRVVNLTFFENPFYVLGVLPTDKRATIVSKAEENAFFLDSNTCNEAQTRLLNPAKRLSAEMDWFCECDASTISGICSSIESHSMICTDNLSGLARLNAALYNFAISDFKDYFEIGYSILDIDEQYSSIKTAAIANAINACRAEAGLLPVSDNEIGRELNKKREQIKHYISEKTLTLSESDYIEFVTILAEKCIANDDYSDGAIINDVVDQYELKMQTSIETASDEITTHIGRIHKIANKDGIEVNLTGLIRRVKKWDKLVQPLQLKSMASGVTHQISEHIGYDIRDFILWLHNEQEMTEQALLLVNSMKDIFAEIGPLADAFSEDAKALNRIINEDKEAKAISSDIKAVERIIEKWKGPDESTDSNTLATNAITDYSVNDLIAKVKALNARIKAINADEETITRLRTGLCITVRDGAIYAHNERQKTASALAIAKMLLEEFGDMAELQEKLSEDVYALNRQLTAINASRPKYSHSYQSASGNSSGSSKKGLIIAAIIFAIMITIAIISGNSGGKPSSSEVKFSDSVTAGTEVYADIVSIFPAIGIYTQGSSNYTHFVCECKTSTGSTMWVYMSASEYRNNFDANVSTSIYYGYQDEKTFSSKRIHGESIKANNVMSGLSFDTGATMLIDFDSVG